MNTMTMTSTGRSRARVRRPFVQPLHEWSPWRTAWTALALFSVVSMIGLQGWRTSDSSRRDASRAALGATQRKADDALRIVTELPALRARATAASTTPPWTAADALHAVAALAAQSGLRVTEIEPLPAAGGARTAVRQPSERALALRADGTFPEIRRFLEALAGLPRLVLPETVQIKRQAGILAIDTTLRIHETLPAVPLSKPARLDVFIVDPFGKDTAAAFSRDAGFLLVGTMLGRHRAMALVQSAKRVEHFEPGQKIGDERLERVQPRAIELAGGDGVSRTLAFEEDRK